MKKDWIMVRLLRTTHARLDACRRSMQLAADVGLRSLEVDDRDRVSLDQVVNLLLDIRDGHAERRRRSSAKRKQRKEIHNDDEQRRETEGLQAEAIAQA